MTIADLYDLELPEVSWVIQDVIPAGSLVLLVGHPKAGKSLLMIDLVASIAAGDSFLGRETTKASTLYLPAEDALPLVVQRLRLRCGDDSAIPLSVLLSSPYADQFVRIDDTYSVERLAQTVEQQKPQVLILDPFRELHQLNENDAEEMATVLRPLRQIAHETGTAIVLVHHRSKHATGASIASRGSSAIAGSVDAIITLDGGELGDQFETGQHVLTLSIEGRYGPRQSFGAQLVDHLRWQVIDKSMMESSNAAQEVLKYLDSCNDHRHTPEEIAAAIARPLRTVQNTLSNLNTAGAVQRSGTGHRDNPFQYFLDIPTHQ